MEAEEGRIERSLQWRGLLDNKAAGVFLVASNNLASAPKLGMKRPNKAAELMI